MNKPSTMWLFYVSALLAIIGGVSYQVLVKQVPASLNPLVSNLGAYAGVVALCIVLMPFFPLEGGLMHHVRQLSWIHIGLAFSVLFIELGFLLMYRAGWNLSTGNLMTGVVMNILLIAIGLLVFHERLTLVNYVGIAMCIVGSVLMNYR